MPRRKQNRQFERMSLDDILAGRVDNDAFFDIDDLAVDTPAIAQTFVPTPLEQVFSNRLDLDSTQDTGAAADENLMGFDPEPSDGLVADLPVFFDADDVSFAAGTEAPRRQAEPAVNDPLGERFLVDGIETSESSARLRNEARRLAIEALKQIRAGFLGAAQGLTLNKSDELEAGVKALIAIAGGDDRPFTEIFGEEVAPIRRLISEARQQQSLASTLGEAAGTILLARRAGPVSRLISLIDELGTLNFEDAGREINPTQRRNAQKTDSIELCGV